MFSVLVAIARARSQDRRACSRTLLQLRSGVGRGYSLRRMRSKQRGWGDDTERAEGGHVGTRRRAEVEVPMRCRETPRTTLTLPSRHRQRAHTSPHKRHHNRDTHSMYHRCPGVDCCDSYRRDVGYDPSCHVTYPLHHGLHCHGSDYGGSDSHARSMAHRPSTRLTRIPARKAHRVPPRPKSAEQESEHKQCTCALESLVLA